MTADDGQQAAVRCEFVVAARELNLSLVTLDG